MSGKVNWSPYERDPFMPGTTQKYVAQLSVGASTIRNMDCCIAGIRRRLAQINLMDLASPDFSNFLDRETRHLQPPCNNQFGPARKCLSIFLKNAYHNKFLSEAFVTDEIVAKFELPLDLRTMRRVREADDANLARSSIIGMTPELHAQYQQSACNIAKLYNVHRVDLDVLWWTNND